MVSWGAVSTSQVPDGSYDELIRTRARALRDLDTPVFLRWMAEMDGHAKAPLAESPAKFTAAWRHIHALSNRRAPTTSPSCGARTPGPTTSARPRLGLVPGRRHRRLGVRRRVQLGSGRGEWTSFEQVLAAFYGWAVTTGKPIMIGEFGALERAPGEKAAWIRAIGPTLRNAFPQVKAIVYFDENKFENGTNYDWRLDSTSASYAAWNHLINDPHLNT